MKLLQKMVLLFVLIILPGCQVLDVARLPMVSATPRPTGTATATLTPAATATETATQTPSLTPTPAFSARRVLILSIDGLRPDAIAMAPMPNLLNLMQNSAYSLRAQTVDPSVTLVSHASMLGGLCPSKHGVDWNDYIPEKGFARGIDLFDLADEAGLQTVMFVGKKKLMQITEPESLDNFVYIPDRDLVIAERIVSEFPEDFRLMFVHFATPDAMGHKYGWLSPEQLSVLFRADEALAMILAELDRRNLRNETLVIITADHGGHDTSHGSERPEDMTIPWIATGPGIQPHELETTVHTMDTAATAAFVLGLDAPEDWDGVPVYEAFGLPVEKQSAQCE